MAEPGRHILIVDDERDIRESLSQVLTALGHEVQVAHDMASALEMFRRRPCRVAVLDYRLPDGDGLTLFGAMKQIRGGTQAVLISGIASYETAKTALANGMRKVLKKPVDFAQLLTVINTLNAETEWQEKEQPCGLQFNA